ncbi:MAG: AAA family ATPase [Oscillospiraceae bacterium]|nr:AAA family ATPase [Oscillospiraceae bacterium]
MVNTVGLKKVCEVFFVILNNEKFAEEMMELEFPEDIYDFFMSIDKDGYSEEEFYTFLNQLLYIYENEILLGDKKNIFKIFGIENAGGGAFGNWKTKFAAGSLAALTSIFPFAGDSAGALRNTANRQKRDLAKAVKSTSETSKSGDPEEKEKKDKPGLLASLKKSAVDFWQEYGEVIEKSLKVCVGSAAMLGGAVIISKLFSKYTVIAQRNFLFKKTEDLVSVKFERTESLEQIRKTIAEDIKKDGTGGSNQYKVMLGKFLDDAENINALSIPTKYVRDLFIPLISIGTVITTLTSKFASFAKTVGDIAGVEYSANSLLRMGNRIREKLETRKREMPPVNELLSQLDFVFNGIRGQEKAKAQIRSHMYDILIQKDLAKRMGKKYEKGDILYFTGPSGVGKSIMANELDAAFSETTAPPFKISSSSVDKASGKSVVEQIFGGYSSRNYYGGEEKQDSSIVQYVKNNPKGVVIIDEYDKFCTPDTDEILRSIIDQGKIPGRNGESTDCSGTVFIITSNERPMIINNFPPRNTTGEEEKITDDGSRTYIRHDKSLVNRMRFVEFGFLEKKDYEKIFRQHLSLSSIGYWMEVSGIHVKITDSVIEKSVAWIEELKQGARSIDLTIIPLINSSIVSTIKKEKLEKAKGRTVSIDFNENTKEFSAKFDD